MSMKISNDIIGNRYRDLPVCSAVPQLRHHRVPHTVFSTFFNIVCDLFYIVLFVNKNYGMYTDFGFIFWVFVLFFPEILNLCFLSFTELHTGPRISDEWMPVHIKFRLCCGNVASKLWLFPATQDLRLPYDPNLPLTIILYSAFNATSL
jgi:hypothetical protein